MVAGTGMEPRVPQLFLAVVGVVAGLAGVGISKRRARGALYTSPGVFLHVVERELVDVWLLLEGGGPVQCRIVNLLEVFRR